MNKIKTYDQFITETNDTKKINESFTISLEQMPNVGDVVDKVDWNEGDKIAFIDFRGVKNIPVQVVGDNNENEAVESTSEAEAEENVA